MPPVSLQQTATDDTPPFAWLDLMWAVMMLLMIAAGTCISIAPVDELAAPPAANEPAAGTQG